MRIMNDLHAVSAAAVCVLDIKPPFFPVGLHKLLLQKPKRIELADLTDLRLDGTHHKRIKRVPVQTATEFQARSESFVLRGLLYAQFPLID